jgi:NAD(P)-dependent dehydrogenase (short-subunit alcohol dehydrogenase family)
MKPLIIITGVGKGFGRQLLLHFIKDYYVIGLTRSEDDIKFIESEIADYKNFFELIAVDLTNHSSLEDRLQRSLELHSNSVYGLINNAGIRYRNSFLETSMTDLKKVIDTNLISAVFLSQIVIPYFIKNGNGRIINISSLLSTNALPELSAYATSKAALDGFTRSIAAEFAHFNITCNSILPGFCETSYHKKFKLNQGLYEMTLSRTPAKRWGSDEELIGVCELLLGARGGFINGASIPVDGGWASC